MDIDDKNNEAPPGVGNEYQGGTVNSDGQSSFTTSSEERESLLSKLVSNEPLQTRDKVALYRIIEELEDDWQGHSKAELLDKLAAIS